MSVTMKSTQDLKDWLLFGDLKQLKQRIIRVHKVPNKRLVINPFFKESQSLLAILR